MYEVLCLVANRLSRRYCRDLEQNYLVLSAHSCADTVDAAGSPSQRKPVALITVPPCLLYEYDYTSFIRTRTSLVQLYITLVQQSTKYMLKLVIISSEHALLRCPSFEVLYSRSAKSLPGARDTLCRGKVDEGYILATVNPSAAQYLAFIQTGSNDTYV